MGGLKTNLILALVFFSLFHFISAGMSDAGVEYDYNLLRAFQDPDYSNKLVQQQDFIGLEIIDNQIWARVGVILKDYSGIFVEGTKEERVELVNQQVAWFENESQNVLKDYTGNNFKLRGMTSGGFGLLVTKEGFEELIKDERIERITWSQYKPELIGNNILSKWSISWGGLILFSLIVVLIILTVFFRRKRKK